MNGRARLAPFVVLAVAFPAATLTAAPARAGTIDRVVAVVNDEPITDYEVRRAMAAARDALKVQGTSPEETRTLVVDELIEAKIREQEAREQGIVVSDAEIDKLIEEIRHDSNITEEQLRATLEREGIAYDAYRDRLREQIQVQKFMARNMRRDIRVTPEIVEEYYDQNVDKYLNPPEVRLAGIFLPVSLADGDAGRAEVQSRIRAIDEELAHGASFEDLAARYSRGPRPKRGGLIGTMGVNQLSPEFRRALEGVPVGGVSKPFEAGGAFVILKRIADLPATPIPLDKIRSRVEREAYQSEMNEAFEDWMATLKTKAQIEILE